MGLQLDLHISSAFGLPVNYTDVSACTSAYTQHTSHPTHSFTNSIQSINHSSKHTNIHKHRMSYRFCLQAHSLRPESRAVVGWGEAAAAATGAEPRYLAEESCYILGRFLPRCFTHGVFLCLSFLFFFFHFLCSFFVFFVGEFMESGRGFLSSQMLPSYVDLIWVLIARYLLLRGCFSDIFLVLFSGIVYDTGSSFNILGRRKREVA